MRAGAMELRDPPFLLLDDAAAPPGTPASRLYTKPREVILARAVDEVCPALARADAALAAGHHLAGWIAYEAAAAFEPRAAAAIGQLPPEPLVWLGVFGPPRRLTAPETAACLDEAMGGTARRGEIAGLRFAETEADYHRKIAQLQEAIGAGEIYQLNYTFSVGIDVAGDTLALYRRLRGAQPVAFGAVIDTGETRILSLSPELFLRSRGGRLEARPMKGTAARGPTLEDDRTRAAALRADPKERAENLMIVDLLRNDLSRVAVPGSVEVPGLFTVETYKTVLQMTSRITARRSEDVAFSELIAALFPCGSVTGAPKLRAMELIGAVEDAPRGVYTGAIGWAEPGGDLCLSVPIRTLVGHAGGEIRFGLGSGIVADSRAADEYEECRLKAQFLRAEPGDPALIETLAWVPETGYRLLERHLGRLADSAAYFGYYCDMAAVRRRLTALADALDTPATVRLLLDRGGEIAATARPRADWPEPVRILLRPLAIASGDPLLRHKTTARDHYELPLAEALAADAADEVVFVTAQGVLTEGARSNLFVSHGGELLTPPETDGLLPGVLRAELLASGKAREKQLHPGELNTADAIYVGNAARGLGRARLIAEAPPARGDHDES